VENHKVPKVTVSLVLQRDPLLEKDKAGYVNIAGVMMRRGTTTRSKSELDEQVDFLGGSLGTTSTGTTASCLTSRFESLFAIFSDVVLHPSFPDSELTKVKRQVLSSLQAAKDDPQSISANVTAVVNFGADHPYGEVETPQTVQAIDVSDLKNYYQRYWRPNIAYMAFVGDITPARARALTEKYLSDWKPAPVPEHQYPVPQDPAHTMVTVVDRPSAVQTNVTITTPIVLKPGQADNFPVKIMNQILGGGMSGWLFQDLREKYGYTYGAYSTVTTDPLVGRFSAMADVRTAVTDSALVRFFYELHRIRNQQVSGLKLDSVKNQLSGDFALALERPSLIAQFALNIARYHMPKDYYTNYLQSIAKVTVSQVQQMARKYIDPDHSNIVLVGNSRAFADKVTSFGPLHYVDIYGNPVTPPAAQQAGSGGATPH
jgi:predicted Zn-dependent peptidase